MSGQASARTDISNMTNANPCVVTTTTNHGYSTGDFIRITDINSAIPVLRGMDQLNNKKVKIIVIDDTSFSLIDPITLLPIDSRTYPPYVEGGMCNLVQTEFIYEGDS